MIIITVPRQSKKFEVAIKKAIKKVQPSNFEIIICFML